MDRSKLSLRKIKLKKINFKKWSINNTLYYIGLIGIPALGILIKNILFQSFVLGKSMYQISVSTGIAQTWKYWGYYLSITMFLLSFCMLFPNDKLRKGYVLVIDLLVTLLVYCDLIYNRSFYTLPSAVNIAMLKNLEGMEGNEVSSLLSGYDILLWFDLIILLVYIIVIRKKDKKEDKEQHKKENSHLRKSFLCMSVICIMIFVAVPVQAKAFNSNKDIYNKLYVNANANEQARYFTTVGFHVRDLFDIAAEQVDSSLSKNELNQIDAYYNWNKDNYKDEYQGVYKGKNVIFIQVESLEAFVLDQKINGQEITPNLNKLINDGIYFDNINEEVKCGNSSDADLMYTTSVLPATKGCTFYRYSDVKLNSLPKMLEDEGYQTEYHQAISATFWNYKQALTNMIGIQKFYGINDYDIDEKIGFTIADESFLKQTEQMIKDNNKNHKFYAHVVCNSSHMPFDIQEKYRALNLPKDMKNNYMGDYIQSIHYVDQSIGSFIKKLDQDGILDQTIIVIAGDHTGIHKYYEDKIKKLYKNYSWCYNEGRKTVPFIIYNKNNKQENVEPYRSDVTGGQIDVMPTLSYLLGIDEENYMQMAMGKNLFNQTRDYALFRDEYIIGDYNNTDYENLKYGYQVADHLFKKLSND